MITREQIEASGIASRTDKITRHGYHRFYDRFLCNFNGYGAIVEIGFGNGESINFWKALFPNAYLYIIDRDISCNGDGFQVLKVDQSSQDQLIGLCKILEGKDIGLIVDDGSHVPEHQLDTFNILFRQLREGGVYIIEDVECSYWRYGCCYGYKTDYGLNSRRSLVNMLSSLPHWINREFMAKREKRAYAIF